MTTNGELKVGAHVIYHDNRKNEDRDALVQVIFHQNGPPPPLTLVLIRSANLGTTVKSMVPHRDDARNKRTEGYWLYVTELDA